MIRLLARRRGAAFLGLGLVLAVWAVPGPGRAQMLDDPEYMMIHKGKPVGPYFVEELQVRMRMGRLRSDTLIWTEGMEDWQAAGKVPAVSKVTSLLSPRFRRPVSQPSPVAVCGAPSSFMKVTVVPALTVRAAGAKAMPDMVTAAPLWLAALAVSAETGRRVRPAPMRSTARRSNVVM